MQMGCNNIFICYLDHKPLFKMTSLPFSISVCWNSIAGSFFRVSNMRGITSFSDLSKYFSNNSFFLNGVVAPWISCNSWSEMTS